MDIGNSKNYLGIRVIADNDFDDDDSSDDDAMAVAPAPTSPGANIPPRRGENFSRSPARETPGGWDSTDAGAAIDDADEDDFLAGLHSPSLSTLS